MIRVSDVTREPCKSNEGRVERGGGKKRGSCGEGIHESWGLGGGGGGGEEWGIKGQRNLGWGGGGGWRRRDGD